MIIVLLLELLNIFIIYEMSVQHILKDQSNNIIYKIVVVMTKASLLIKLYNSKSKYEQIYLKQTLLPNTYILSGSYSVILYRNLITIKRLLAAMVSTHFFIR